MPPYHRLGEIRQNGIRSFVSRTARSYSEELFASRGSPTTTRTSITTSSNACEERLSRFGNPGLKNGRSMCSVHHHLKPRRIQPSGDAVLGNQILMFNKDLIIGSSPCLQSNELLLSRRRSDTMYFVHDGHVCWRRTSACCPITKATTLSSLAHNVPLNIAAD